MSSHAVSCVQKKTVADATAVLPLSAADPLIWDERREIFGPPEWAGETKPV